MDDSRGTDGGATCGPIPCRPTTSATIRPAVVPASILKAGTTASCISRTSYSSRRRPRAWTMSRRTWARSSKRPSRRSNRRGPSTKTTLSSCPGTSHRRKQNISFLPPSPSRRRRWCVLAATTSRRCSRGRTSTRPNGEKQLVTEAAASRPPSGQGVFLLHDVPEMRRGLRQELRCPGRRDEGRPAIEQLNGPGRPVTPHPI